MKTYIVEAKEKNAQFSIRSRLEFLEQRKQSLVEWQVDGLVKRQSCIYY